MIACVDVQYDGDAACTGLVLFADWTSSDALSVHTTNSVCQSPYLSGQFYKRELPCIMAALDELAQTPNIVIIDGYVWLDRDEQGVNKHGLGAHLFEALKQQISIVGVAKKSFAGSNAVEVFRGASNNPLYVTTAGIDLQDAAACVEKMHGKNRLPTMIKLADKLARQLP